MMAGQLDTLKNAIDNRPDAPPKPKTITDFIEEATPQLARALPAAAKMTPERFARLAMTTIKANPKLASCTRDSMLGAMMTSAHLGLEPGPLDLVYWTPRARNFKDANNQWQSVQEVNLVVGYKGFLELARRAGVQAVARPVYENDFFDIDYGFAESVTHKPALKNRGDVIGYYLAAKWDGGQHVSFMPKEDIEKIRQRSDAGRDRAPTEKTQPSGPWVTDYDVMACKSVIRAAFNRNHIPRTLEIGQALNADETVQTGWRGEEQLDKPRLNVTEVREIDSGQGTDSDPREDDPGVDSGGSGDGAGSVGDAAAVVDVEGARGSEADGVVVEGDDVSDVDPSPAPRRPSELTVAQWIVTLTEAELKAVCKAWADSELEFMPKSPKAWAALAKALGDCEPFE